MGILLYHAILHGTNINIVILISLSYQSLLYFQYSSNRGSNFLIFLLTFQKTTVQYLNLPKGSFKYNNMRKQDRIDSDLGRELFEEAGEGLTVQRLVRLRGMKAETRAREVLAEAGANFPWLRRGKL